METMWVYHDERAERHVSSFWCASTISQWLNAVLTRLCRAVTPPAPATTGDQSLYSKRRCKLEEELASVYHVVARKTLEVKPTVDRRAARN